MTPEPTFSKDYYDRIWGTVHRHDYCQDLSERLVAKYGRVRILDIGTGCGHLVKCLRELGCDAWGVDVSRYAIANSCAPDYVRLGDIRNLPFAADSFDVVHSQGLWGYFPESDIQKAWQECQRVGQLHEHAIDTQNDEPSHQLVIERPLEWWHNQFYPKVLVACPNHEVKEYAVQTWIETVRALSYPNFDVLMVDNSPTDAFFKRWQDKIPMARIEPPAGVNKRINYSMEVIRQKFLAGPYARWFNLESDTIPEPRDVIERMLRWGGDTDWIAHAYPERSIDGEKNLQQGIGCSMLSRRLIETFDFRSIGDSMPPDSGLWGSVRPRPEFRTMELWGYFKIRHLRE